jgi:hypothetical protein
MSIIPNQRDDRILRAADGQACAPPSRSTELVAYRSQRGMGFRTRPAGRWWTARSGRARSTCRKPAQRGRRLASKPFKFTLTGPHMLAKSVIDKHYGNGPDLAMAIADALAAQVKHLMPDVVQIDEANIPGSPDEWRWAAARDEPGVGCDQDHALRCICVLAITAARQSRRANGQS